MGLITTEVELRLNSNNIKYYENLGYKIPREKDKQGHRITIPRGTKIKINVKDLTNGSKVLIDICCDNCGKVINNIKWQSYKRYVKEDGKYYCVKCANKLYSNENTRLTKLKNGKSFEKWCIGNNRQDVLDRWDYELNQYKPDEISFSSGIKCYFKCPRKIHESELKNIKSLTNNKQQNIDCNQCNSFAQWGIDNLGDDFLDKYWDYDKNRLNPWEIQKGSNNKKVWIKCQEKNYHDSYEIRCADFTNEVRCSYCCNYHGKVHRLDSLGILYPQVLKIWSDKNKKSPYEYTPSSSKKIWWKCQEGKHEDYFRDIHNSNKFNFRCPECSRERDESFLQEKVRLYLNKLGYSVLHEYNCTLKCINPKTKNILPYDNEILELKLIIEVHGSQHYLKSGGKWIKNEFELHMQKLRDRYKRIFAKSQGYFYLEIPYWKDDTNETWKKLINNKINKITINKRK